MGWSAVDKGGGSRQGSAAAGSREPVAIAERPDGRGGVFSGDDVCRKFRLCCHRLLILSVGTLSLTGAVPRIKPPLCNHMTDTKSFYRGFLQCRPKFEQFSEIVGNAESPFYL